jgi:outer membrane lipoprotein-sorting protein
MTNSSRQLVVAVVVLLMGHTASAQQSAADVIERSLTALGGRAAHSKLQSRSATGTIALTTPAGDIAGTLELLNAAPNKTRMLLKADLSALGAGELVVDQRFDGNVGYVLDSLQGNREITGNQLDNMKNSSFPHPFIDFKDRGTSAQLAGKESVGGRDAYVVVFDPASGSQVRNYIDAESYLPIKTVMKVDIPQLGQEVEQTTEFFDYKEVDGVKIPFRIKTSSSIQSITITLTGVDHNVKVDDALFVKPGAIN